MKLLHIITSLQIGGAEKLLLDSIPYYKKRGIQVDLLLLNDSNTIFLEQLRKLEVCNIYSLGKGSVYNPFLIFKILPYLSRYNLVHVHLFPTIYWVALAKYLSFSSSCSLIYTEHNTHNKRRNIKWLKPIEFYIYKKYKEIICISEKTCENLCSWIKLRNSGTRINIIHNGIDIAKFNNAKPLNKNLLDIPEHAKIILMTARFNIQKDPDTLIRAFSLLNNRNIFLVFVGDGILRKKSEELVEELGIQQNVLFLGIRIDVPKLVKMSDICVLSSNWEGFGLVSVEYMAARRPTIVSNIDGLSDIVKGAGLLFAKGDSYDLKEKLDLLLYDKQKYNEISEACYLRSQNYSIENMVNSYIEVYRKVILQYNPLRQ